MCVTVLLKHSHERARQAYLKVSKSRLKGIELAAHICSSSSCFSAVVGRLRKPSQTRCERREVADQVSAICLNHASAN